MYAWVITWLAFWVLVIAGLILMVRSVVAKKGVAQILDERYARGEITRDEYLRKKKDLPGVTRAGGRLRLVAGILIFFLGALGLIHLYSASMLGPMRSMMGRGDGLRDIMGMEDMMANVEEIDMKREFASFGESIYLRGIGSNGDFIKNSHGMKGVGCATCHGIDAGGMRMLMMEVPPLRWDFLAVPEGHSHLNRRAHPPFTEASFKSCVVYGVDPAGNTLSTLMPKWEMSDEDIGHLIEYLKAAAKR